MREKREAILKVTAELVPDIIASLGTARAAGSRIVENPIPDDARCVRIFYENSNPGALCFVLESPAFEPVNEGEMIPVLPAPVIGTCAVCEERFIPHDDEVCSEVDAV